MENTLSLDTLKVSNLPELQGWKEKQEALVAENPYVEISDNKTYDVACKSRTALLKGRTELEKQDKLVASKLATFRKEVKTETDLLIAITLPSEEKQQAEVKRYEGIKEVEKMERERLEQLRIATIKAKIDELETAAYESIKMMVFEEMDEYATSVIEIDTTNFDFEEFDILRQQAVLRVRKVAEDKVADLYEKEEQRAENERLVEEAKVATAKAKELHDQIDADNAEREAKAQIKKEQTFEIRKNRLSEIGFEITIGLYKGQSGNVDPKTLKNLFINKNIVLDEVDIINADEIDFETIISDAKLVIEKTKSDAEEAEKQKAIDLQLAKADADKLKKESKARIKKYANDKKNLTEYVRRLEFTGVLHELENKEMQPLLDSILLELENTRGFLLTNINLF